MNIGLVTILITITTIILPADIQMTEDQLEGAQRIFLQNLREIPHSGKSEQTIIQERRFPETDQ
jgi:hypothetical protein